MPLVDTFQRFTGREPSAEERTRLTRIQEAAGLRDNDAFCAIVVAFEQYNGLYAEYPTKISAEAKRVLGEMRETMTAAANQELAECQNRLTRHVTDVSLELSRKRAARPVSIHEVTTMAATLVLFGSICVTTGYKLGSATKPFWVNSAAPEGGVAHALAVLAGAPAGWMALLLFLPLALYGVRCGWASASDVGAAGLERAGGWALIGLSTLGAVGAALLLVKFT